MFYYGPYKNAAPPELKGNTIKGYKDAAPPELRGMIVICNQKKHFIED